MEIEKTRGTGKLLGEKFDISIDVEKPDYFSIYISDDSVEVENLTAFELRREGSRLELASGGYKVEVEVRGRAAKARISSPCGDAAVDFEPTEDEEEWRVKEGCLEFSMMAIDLSI